MPARNSKNAYGYVAIALHWLLGLAIIGMLILGLYMEGLSLTPGKLNLYGIHKSIGSLILIAVAARLLWRLANPTPELPAHMSRAERWLVHLGHLGLYFCMFAMPMSGWLMSSAAGFPVSVFGWVTLPDLVEKGHEWRQYFGLAHTYVSYLMIGLIGAHFIAALLHHFVHKDNVLSRMLPLVTPRKS